MNISPYTDYPLFSDTVSELVAPLTYRSQVIGVCSFESHRKSNFTTKDVRKVEIALNLLGQYIALIGRFKESWQTMANKERYILVLSLCLE